MVMRRDELEVEQPWGGGQREEQQDGTETDRGT